MWTEGSTRQPRVRPTDRPRARNAATDAIPVRYPRFMTRDRLRTAVVGAGYVGIATAVGLAEQGRDIALVEQDPARLTALADGRTPFHEPGLPRGVRVRRGAIRGAGPWSAGRVPVSPASRSPIRRGRAEAHRARSSVHPERPQR